MSPRGGAGKEIWIAAVSGTLRGVRARYLTCSADWLGAICVFVIVYVRTRHEGERSRIAGAWGLGV